MEIGWRDMKSSYSANNLDADLKRDVGSSAKNEFTGGMIQLHRIHTRSVIPIKSGFKIGANPGVLN